MCAFYNTSGCYHGNSCDYAHDQAELQALPDLRKSTLCLNFSQGYVDPFTYKYLLHRRCAVADCRFAHGCDELRLSEAIPEQSCPPCSMWSSGRCLPGARCSYAHSFEAGSIPWNDPPAVVKTTIRLADAISSNILSLDDALSDCSGFAPRRRIDLFACLTFEDDIKPDTRDGDVLLRSISTEVRSRSLADECCLVDGDNSPWNLPH